MNIIYYLIYCVLIAVRNIAVIGKGQHTDTFLIPAVGK
jgi:hypothetical protein